MRVRLFLAFALLAGPVQAWDFAPTPICTLSTQTEKGEVRVTYDPTTGLYEINLIYANDLSWDNSPSFTMEFIGPSSLSIGTNRHAISRDGKTLSARDTGFGNVLDGLEFNTIANARAGSSTMAISLEGAAEPVRKFRACGEVVVS